METIVIVGWYGTETVGDRGILAGLIKVFATKFLQFNLRIGSLYPFFSKRCMQEDYSFFKSISNDRLQDVTIFDSKIMTELKQNIDESTLLCFGGGLLMDIQFIYIMDYAFYYARHIKVRTAILGCGMGLLKNRHIISSVCHLIENTDTIVLSDESSCKTYQDLGGKRECLSAIDPACFCAQYFLDSADLSLQYSSNSVAFNFRDVAMDLNDINNVNEYNTFFASLVQKELNETDRKIRLIPMHTFKQGGDDRYYLNDLIKRIEDVHHCVSVQNVPLSLYETMMEFYSADHCYGMRFHSILYQTILNGRNIILDYTDPQKGKIKELLRQLDLEQNYQNSYVRLTSLPLKTSFSLPIEDKSKIQKKINTYFQLYIDAL